jgi:hypothetical protein
VAITPSMYMHMVRGRILEKPVSSFIYPGGQGGSGGEGRNGSGGNGGRGEGPSMRTGGEFPLAGTVQIDHHYYPQVSKRQTC